jgi:flagellar motor protein MotB
MAPLVSNATPEGRHENRRIDIVVHPESIARE